MKEGTLSKPSKELNINVPGSALMIGIYMGHQGVTGAVDPLADDASVLLLSLCVLVRYVSLEASLAAQNLAAQLAGEELLRRGCVQRVQRQTWHRGEHCNTQQHNTHFPASLADLFLKSLFNVSPFFWASQFVTYQFKLKRKLKKKQNNNVLSLSTHLFRVGQKLESWSQL